ncbi:MAG: hypothetical protein GQ571_09520 [Desulfobacterales bacterium]|nr:hypothetical protein [Desulfobacterales bacterium]
MRLLEYESKEILSKYQIPTPAATLISKGGPFDIKGPVMLKSQIPVGGRGKSGGILEASTNDDAKTPIEYLLSTPLKGYKATQILIEEKMQVKQEFFMAVTYDTVIKAPVAIFPEGEAWILKPWPPVNPERCGRSRFRFDPNCPGIVPGKLFRKPVLRAVICSVWRQYFQS